MEKDTTTYVGLDDSKRKLVVAITTFLTTTLRASARSEITPGGA